MLQVFKPPESVKLNQLTAAAMSRYEEVPFSIISSGIFFPFHVFEN